MKDHYGLFTVSYCDTIQCFHTKLSLSRLLSLLQNKKFGILTIDFFDFGSRISFEKLVELSNSDLCSYSVDVDIDHLNANVYVPFDDLSLSFNL